MARESARTKRNIVRQIARELGLPRTLTERVVKRMFDAIVEAIAMDERIEFRNFGVFQVKKRPARKARNPQTGETIDVPARCSVSFRAGKELEAVLQQIQQREPAPEQASGGKPRAGRKNSARPAGETAATPPAQSSTEDPDRDSAGKKSAPSDPARPEQPPTDPR